jgi:hypothetical protein
MTAAMPPEAASRVPRGRLRADLVYLGWQHEPGQADPGPMPPPPDEAGLAEVSADWLAAQRREQDLLSRPARLASALGAAVTAAAAACALTGAVPAWLGLAAAVGGAGVTTVCVRAILRGERALRAGIQSERVRVQQIRTAQLAELAASRQRHASSYRDWQQRSAAFRRQPQWYPVTLPAAVSRLDVAGGTLAGWSALLTMIATPRLAAGGELTVLDLTEGGVAADLVALATGWGLSPLVWVLPDDLPRLDLGLQLDRPSLADVLALTAAAGGQPGAEGDLARDAALLGRVLDVLGDGADIAQLTAALRALGHIGSPSEQLSARTLRAEQLAAVSTLFGRGAEQLVIERAWALEARLRSLSPLGTALASAPGSPLRVAWPDRRGSALGNRVLGRYLVVALTEALRQAPPGRPWQQAICVLGAEWLPGEVIDRLCDAAEAARAGLVLGYRSIPPPVRERLGRGNASIAFMRLGNAEDAKAAAEQIGTEHRFVVSQFTDTVGASVTDTAGDSYTSTVGTSDSVADSRSATLTSGRSRGRGRTRPVTFAPFAEGSGSASRDASSSTALSDSRSLTAGISDSTSWGLSTSRAVGASSSLAGTAQRSREFVVEQHELQHLPQTALVLCRRGPAGREVVLADANPAIMTLPTATLARRPP